MESELDSGLGLPRRVVITGGSSGIGLATARLFLSHGANVGIIGRDSGRLHAAATELAQQAPQDGQDRVFEAQADVGNDDEIGPAIDALAGQLGGIDAVITAAGIEGEMGAAVPEVTAPSFREVLGVNVVGSFLAIQQALPHLHESAHGSAVIVGSDSGFVSVPGMLAYNAAKGALVQLTRALAVELFETHGVRVNSVCPSIVDTPMARRGLGVESFEDEPYPVQDPADIAWSVAYLTSSRSRAINGVNLLSDFGYTGKSSFPA
ncbi:SDR family NAD(P)-dependent oxidoreductase [Citricoccus sp. GCM10030269]|uniref:SDR family NAD(P)-dependent oxidoreductase n=1 Tax=Citricoccus sp. GCM10030269 TaxID=3273388 RepID=UPI00360B4A5A